MNIWKKLNDTLRLGELYCIWVISQKTVKSKGVCACMCLLAYFMALAPSWVIGPGSYRPDERWAWMELKKQDYLPTGTPDSSWDKFRALWVHTHVGIQLLTQAVHDTRTWNGGRALMTVLKLLTRGSARKIPRAGFPRVINKVDWLILEQHCLTEIEFQSCVSF